MFRIWKPSTPGCAMALAADGRGAATYDSPKTAVPPPELVAALAASPQAETRARRIAAFVAILEG